MKYLVFSHGFGVQKDSKGMFTEIAKAFPGHQSIMFDYNKYIESKNTTTVRSYRHQSKKLKSIIEGILKDDPGADIAIIAHSQGAIVASLLKNTQINKAVLLAPPTNVSARRSRLRPNRKITHTGAVRIYKKDGSQIYLTTGFMLGLHLTKPIKLYQKLSNKVDTSIIVAKQDEMIKRPDFSTLKNAKIYTINGDHNFTGNNRKGLISTVKSILQ